MGEPEIKLTRGKLKRIVNDHEQTALIAKLIYVSDASPGIERCRRGRAFFYRYKGKTITEAVVLKRIQSLMIPPAWKSVWICPEPDGHLQVTGLDARNRKQYKYHPVWSVLRSHTKFFNLYDFGKALPAIRKRIEKDLSRKGLPQEKVLAAVVALMQCTCIRIGNSFYEKVNGSFGLTTLKDRHVHINGQSLQFSFKGKKGVYHDIALKSRRLARIVQACKDIPGKELFQYYDESGRRKSIDSGMVNAYIKEISGGNFTAKDFRTWAGSLHALRAFRELGCCDTDTQIKKNISEALERVARQLNNTRAVCRKYYVHPVLINLYSDKGIEQYFREMEEPADCRLPDAPLTDEEQILMKILSKSDHVIAV